MSYLDRLKTQNPEKRATKALSKLPKGPYDSFGSSLGGHFSENTTSSSADTAPATDGDRTSEAAHNAAGRYFKLVATWPDGRQCYLCQMPRQTVDEMQEQFPDATNIEPVQNEDYPDD
jgi:hypothetical protein